jgi:hypothetical protein
MKALMLAGLLATGLIFAEIANAAIVIPLYARIYIDAGSGFDVYLTTALEKRHVPLTVTTDESKADYAIEGISPSDKERTSDEGGARLVDLRNGEVVLSWPVERKRALYNKRTAEALATLLESSVPPVFLRYKHSILFSKNPALDF